MDINTLIIVGIIYLIVRAVQKRRHKHEWTNWEVIDVHDRYVAMDTLVTGKRRCADCGRVETKMYPVPLDEHTRLDSIFASRRLYEQEKIRQERESWENQDAFENVETGEFEPINIYHLNGVDEPEPEYKYEAKDYDRYAPGEPHRHNPRTPSEAGVIQEGFDRIFE